MIRTLRGNRIPLPDTKQQRSHTCGPAVLSSIFNYWGYLADELELAEELSSDPVGGTCPDMLQKAAIGRGFNTIWHEGMSNSDLTRYLDSGRPVIITVQAWASTQAELEGDSGHYVIAIDYDENNVYFEDPALDDCRGYIPWVELNERWHDKDKTGKTYNRFGLVVWKNSKPVYKSVISNVALICVKDIPFVKGAK
jgi:predicted double-glycine peptidase